MKLIKYVVLFIAAFIWLSGLNADVFNVLGKFGFVHDGYQFGDLYRLSNLPQFKDPKKSCPEFTPTHANPRDKKVNLFIIGDSFTEAGRISKTNFNVDSYHYINWAQSLHIKLDTSEHNILLIECVERHFREKFVAPIGNIVEDSATFVNSGHPSFMQELDAAFASKSTQDRLEMLLFQNDAMLQVKEWKAAFNQKFFDRASNDVELVNSNRDIVFYMDTDTMQSPPFMKLPAKTTSSFTFLPSSEVDTLVVNVMRSKVLMEKMGFDKVLLSIIPNKVSVVMPDYGNYNNLISRVYTHPSFKLQTIDVLSDFRTIKNRAYLKGDSHWTCESQNIWLNKTNKLINDAVASTN